MSSIENKPGVERGNWKCELTIGSGGFGTVTLWKNKETDEKIAIKQCRLHLERKYRSRWELEVEIMEKLDHLNVVKAIPVPKALSVSSQELPLLGMEYCSGGDLRKVLSKPNNCCGLEENMCLELLKSVGSAIEYLHSKRIIHRDLKPENIIIQPNNDGKDVYKLIDLGYAKQLDQSSLCNSFVGTLQYLAPELFIDKEYTKTVDYWSFGTLIFECIVGYRPFLPTLPPVQWHNEVKKKDSNDICAYLNKNGEIVFTSFIPSACKLNKYLEERLSKWLHLMLQWDSEKRGGGLTIDNRPKCFFLLEEIISLKIVNILCVDTNELFTYPLKEEMSILDLQQMIKKDTGIELEDQEMLMPTGVSLDPRKPALQCWPEPGRDDWAVYLFRRGGMKHPPKPKPLPDVVKDLMLEPGTLLPYIEQKRAWAQACHHCSQVATEHQRLMQGERAIMMSLLRCNSNLSKFGQKLNEELNRLKYYVNFFKITHQNDMSYYQAQAENGIASDSMFDSWNMMDMEVEKINQAIEQVKHLLQQNVVIQTKLVEIQRSPYSKHKQLELLQDIVREALDEYKKLQQKPKERRHVFEDNIAMAKVLNKCRKKSEHLNNDLYSHISKIVSLKSELLQQLPKVESKISILTEYQQTILKHQKQRQKDVWTLVKVAVKYQPTNNLMRSSSNSSSEISAASSFNQENMGKESSLAIMEELEETCRQFSSLLDNYDNTNDEN